MPKISEASELLRYVYDFVCESESNMCHIDDNDWNELKDSKCLFARKFDLNIDKEIIEKIYNYTNN